MLSEMSRKRTVTRAKGLKVLETIKVATAFGNEVLTKNVMTLVVVSVFVL